jgi:hypothetical protein
MHRTILLLSLSVGIVASTVAATPTPPAADSTPPAGNPDAPKGGRSGHSAMTIAAITENTDAGRQVPPPTPDQPVYVATHFGGRRDFGRRVAGQEAPSDASLQQQLDAALAADHYLAATTEHPPSLLLIFSWGLHANLDDATEDPGYTNVLDRTALVGGRKFADELKAALKADNLSAAATPTQPWGAQLPGMRPTGASSLFHDFSPMEVFRKRDLLTQRLLEQISNDCYYVVVSALDNAALARGERRLLWRTKLSASAQGASLAGTIPALIKAGTGRFGQDMSGPELVSASTE